MSSSTSILRKLYTRCSYSQCSIVRGIRAQSIQAGPSPEAAPTSTTRAAKLTTRRLIHLHGDEAPKFLQGIITNNVGTETNINNGGLFAAFLTAQGKVLHDVFIYSTTTSGWHKDTVGNDDPGFMIEVDAAQVENLLKHLKRHKLRSKFKMRLLDAEELDVWSVWKEDERWTQHTGATVDDSGLIALQDMRAPGMGNRLLLPSTEPPIGNVESLEDAVETSGEAYTMRRYMKGVPEGQDEIPRDDCLPMNYNFDIMNGIDFKKGCYIGQELTIRTHHTGVVRRRVLPIVLYPSDAPPPDQQIFDDQFQHAITTPNLDIKSEASSKRATGKLIASIGNVGLAICRLEQMSDLNVNGTGSSFDPAQRFIVEQGDRKVGVKPFVPDWMRGRIREPRVQRRVE